MLKYISLECETMEIHVVKSGESVYSIANQYGVSWQK